MDVNFFDRWNRGCVPFLNKLWNKIDSDLIGNIYIDDGKIMINHIDGISREIILNDAVDSVCNDNTLAIYIDEGLYKIGKVYNVNFIRDKNDFAIKLIALKKGRGHIMVSRKFSGYASIFEIRDDRDKKCFFRIEFQDNDDFLDNEDIFIDRLFDITSDSKIEDVYNIVHKKVCNYKNYSKIIMEKIYYKNTFYYENKILGSIVLENGNLKKLITDRKLDEAVISFDYDADKGCSFIYNGKNGIELDNLYGLVDDVKKLVNSK